MILSSLDELLVRRPLGEELRAHERNAHLQSALDDLRAVIGFLLAYVNDFKRRKDGTYPGMPTYREDVGPGWYSPNRQVWMPRTIRRRRALYSFYGRVGTHLANIAIKSTRHPGPWPIVEAAAVVGQDLQALIEVLNSDAPIEAARFEGFATPPSDTIAVQLKRPYLCPYPTPVAEPTVARARHLLRTQLGWPTQNAS